MTPGDKAPDHSMYARALLNALQRTMSTDPDDARRLNMSVAETWLSLLQSGHSADDLASLLDAVDRLPFVGSITTDLQLAARAWVREKLRHSP